MAERMDGRIGGMVEMRNGYIRTIYGTVHTDIDTDDDDDDDDDNDDDDDDNGDDTLIFDTI